MSFRKEHIPRTIFVIVNTILLIIVAMTIVVPLVNIISDSLDERAATYVFTLVPQRFTTYAYRLILSQRSLYRPFFISIFVTITGTALSLILTTMLAYGLNQRGLPGRSIISYAVLITMVFRAGIIPTYMVVRSLGILNTLAPIILVNSVNTFYLILMMNFFRTVPNDFREAARVEGASEFRVFARIILPLSKAGLAAIGLFYAVYYWNEFFAYVIYLNDSSLYNFQVVLQTLVQEGESLGGMPRIDTSTLAPESLKNAAIIVAVIPVAILYTFIQRHFVQGVNLGGLKG